MIEYKVCNTNINEIHQYLYEILVEFDRICCENNIMYSLEGGTLLGAVKYGGFVPWDDDIDIVMLREEYEKFLEICKTQLNKKFYVQNCSTDTFFPLSFTKLRYKNSSYVQKNYCHLNFDEGLFIDIYPLDNVSKSTLRLKMLMIGLFNGAKQVKLGLLNSKFRQCNNISKTKSIFYRMLSLAPLDFLNKSLICIMYSKKRSQYVYNLCNPNYKKNLLLYDDFTNLVKIRFCDKDFYCIKNFESWLRIEFGNYMDTEPNVSQRGPSHAIVECTLPAHYEKKIGIMTFHRADNYGAVLQSYALTHYIDNRIKEKNILCNVEIIDYYNEAIENRYIVKKYSDIPKIKTKVKYLLIRRHMINNQKNFSIFRKKFLNVSENSYKKSNILDAFKMYDYLICGSDQIWNGLLTDDDETYFFSNDVMTKKISYAASAGNEEYFIKNFSKYLPLLESFSNISVRELELKKELDKKGINCSLVLDPVFLLEKEDYEKIESNKNIVDFKYILVYVIAFERSMYKFAKKLASEKNLKIVYINVDKIYEPGAYNLRNVPIENFLTLIKNAEYVITSSFHGIAFSLIYNKEFYYQMSTQNSNFNSRIKTLLSLAKIDGRSIQEGYDLKPINWKLVNDNINKMRVVSKEFLERSVFDEL